MVPLRSNFGNMPCEVAKQSPGQFPTAARYDCVFSLKIQYCASGNRVIPFINPPSLQDYQNQRNYVPAFAVVIWPEIGHNSYVVYRIVFTENAIDAFNRSIE
jgi:hypothetical protein